MIDWNDLKYLLAVARHGSTIAAAKALGTSQSTVQRRLAELEKQVGHKIATRTPAGYQLTATGKSLVPYAERVQAAVDDFEQQTRGHGHNVAGIIRVTCPEPIVQRMMPIVHKFHDAHPGLSVEFIMSDKYLDLAKGDADVAFRSGDTDDDLIGRKIADSFWAIYASAEYVSLHGMPETAADLARHAIVSLDGTMSAHRVAKWLAVAVPEARIVARNNSVLGMMYAVKSGVGIGPLPTAIAEQQADLVRVFGPVPELARSWRVLTHPDLRLVPRIATFIDFVMKEREALRVILSG